MVGIFLLGFFLDSPLLDGQLLKLIHHPLQILSLAWLMQTQL
jgi:hypothetical protein